mgnify:CR=1 FL=1
MSYEIKYEDRTNCIPTFLGENAKGGVHVNAMYASLTLSVSFSHTVV